MRTGLTVPALSTAAIRIRVSGVPVEGAYFRERPRDECWFEARFARGCSFSPATTWLWLLYVLARLGYGYPHLLKLHVLQPQNTFPPPLSLRVENTVNIRIESVLFEYIADKGKGRLYQSLHFVRKAWKRKQKSSCLTHQTSHHWFYRSFRTSAPTSQYRCNP